MNTVSTTHIPKFDKQTSQFVRDYVQRIRGSDWDILWVSVSPARSPQFRDGYFIVNRSSTNTWSITHSSRLIYLIHDQYNQTEAVINNFESRNHQARIDLQV